jgi:hypothetical protein
VLEFLDLALAVAASSLGSIWITTDVKNESYRGASAGERHFEALISTTNVEPVTPGTVRQVPTIVAHEMSESATLVQNGEYEAMIEKIVHARTAFRSLNRADHRRIAGCFTHPERS